MADRLESESTRISGRLEAVIEATAERIHYAEGRRSSYATMAGVLIAASIAVFTLAFGSIDQEWLRWLGFFATVSMFSVGAGTIWIYGRQTNRYPWTDSTKVWKWFYRDALPDAKKFSLPWTSYLPFGWEDLKTKSQQQYREQLIPFKNRISELSDDKINLVQDMEQLYVLHINELYKNLHLSSIRTFFNRGIIAIILSLFLGALVGFLVDITDHEPKKFTSVSPDFQEILTVRLLNSPLLDQSQFSGKAIIVNTGKKPLKIEKISALDGDGWLIPLTLTSEPITLTVPPSGSLTTYFTYSIANVLINQIKQLQFVEK